MNVYDEIAAERFAQDQKWGGTEHDIDHSPNDWVAYIAKHAGRAAEGKDFRKQMVRVAALAVAAIEAYDSRLRAHGIIK